MEDDSRRMPGSPLSAHERVLLDLLCSDSWPEMKEAREQAVHARWGG